MWVDLSWHNESRESLLPLTTLPEEDTMRSRQSTILKRVLASTQQCRHVELGLPAFRTMRNNSCCSPGVGKWKPSPVFLPGKFHGQRNYSPCGCKESDMTENTCCLKATKPTLCYGSPN